MDILSRQEVSRLGLKRKLAPHAESEEELENILNEFSERNWQSDLRYAEAYIHSKSRKLLPDRLSEKQTAMDVLRKKFKHPAADLKEKQKQARFLAYRGFDADTVQTALKHAWDDGWEEDC